MMAFAVTIKPIQRFLYQASSITVGILLYFLLTSLLISLIHWLFPLSIIHRGLLSGGLALFISIYGIWNAWQPRVRNVKIAVPGLASNIRAVQLSDIHLGNFRGSRFLYKVADKVKDLNPEIIFNTGDLFDGRIQLKPDTLNAFKDIEAPHYFIEGNHDIHVGVNRVYALAANAGLKILKNEIAYYKDLQIIGLRYMMADSEQYDIHAAAGRMTIQSVLNDLPIDRKKPSVLLHHTPSGFQYASFHQINLMLAGHTHAGQMWPLIHIAKMIFGYNKGLYKYHDLFIYVSQGVGTMFSPMRVGTVSEITVIDLITAS